MTKDLPDFMFETLSQSLITSTFPCSSLSFSRVCVCVEEQGTCPLHVDLNTALKLHSRERPAALPSYPNTMVSICKVLHKARTVSQLLFSWCED